MAFQGGSSGSLGVNPPQLASMHPQLNINQTSENFGNSAIQGAINPPTQGDNMGPSIAPSFNPNDAEPSVLNSYADNMNYQDSMNKEERYM